MVKSNRVRGVGNLENSSFNPCANSSLFVNQPPRYFHRTSPSPWTTVSGATSDVRLEHRWKGFPEDHRGRTSCFFEFLNAKRQNVCANISKASETFFLKPGQGPDFQWLAKYQKPFPNHKGESTFFLTKSKSLKYSVH
ncbi:hypothetical protein JTE90_015462 [Oedothorax gibbosus]|uniref:Uncharacterized protein n=1 Tax=Oedothorax gibbosus TaxID=931172 RepID=A0AAV6UBA4_9ARAC|nr:hypothetical protein JTE90_015462 [Oedothorax gibbosus]